jgi:hypothetical protein
MEDLISALVERTDITKFSCNMVYELLEDTDAYNELFMETSEGPRMMLPVVPDKARFTQFIRKITDIRTRSRSGCAMDVRIGAKVDFSVLSLLHASYQPKMDSSDLGYPPSQYPRSVSRGCDANLSTAEETQIDFRIDGGGHADLQRRVTYSYPEYRSAMSEDSDMTAYSDSEEDEI